MENWKRLQNVCNQIAPFASLSRSNTISCHNVAEMQATSTGIQPYLNVCFVGDEDSGKSTTVEHLQLLLGDDSIVIGKLTDDAEKLGRDTFESAYDITGKEERERGITIDTNLIQWKTQKYDLNVIDCLIDKEFIQHMVTGAERADVTVVIVSCAPNEFESAISGGTLKDPIVISGFLGCSKVVVCVNKVDTVPPVNQPARYAEVANEMKALVAKNHPDKDPIIIPISGCNDIGLIEASEKYGWFKGFSPAKDSNVKIFSLEAALNYQTAPTRGYMKPLRMPITLKHKISGVGAVFSGRVAGGVMKPHMKVQIQPFSIDCSIKTVEIRGKLQTEVHCGQNCGVALDLTKAEDLKKIKVGSVISEAGENSLKMAYGAVVKVLITDHNGALKPGYSPFMDLATQHVPTRLAKFISKKAESSPLIENPDTITKGDEVIAVMVPKKDIAFEIMSDFPYLGKFALRDVGNVGKIVGIGSIQEKLSKEDLQRRYGIDWSTVWKKEY